MSYEKENSVLYAANEASAYYGVPTALILAHIKQESNFNPNAIREEPAINDASIGLMQVLVQTAKFIDKSATREKLFDPWYNISIGTQYLSYQKTRYDDIKDVIASYNAGSAYVDQNNKYVSKSGNDVQNYVDRVYANYQNYLNWLNGYGDNTELVSASIVTIIIAIGIGIWAYKRKK